MTAAAVLAGCLALLSIAAWLTPSAHGVGTHRQMGYPPCAMPVVFGVPCPTCGMTTAFAHAVRGELFSAFHAQPAGLLIALATMVIGLVAASVLITGHVWAVNWYRVRPARVGAAVALILLGGWAYKLVVSLADGSAAVTG